MMNANTTIENMTMTEIMELAKKALESKNNTNTIKIAEFGELTFEGRSGIPTLEIKIDGLHSGYLTPFRKYCFQVSSNKEGDGDFGSSGIVQFNQLECLNNKVVTANVMKAMAVDAVAEYCNRYKAVCPDIHIGWGITTFKEFMKTAFEWVTGQNYPFIV